MMQNRNLTSAVLLIGLIVITVGVFWLNDWFKHQREFHGIQIKQQAELIESNKKSGYVHLVANMLDLIDAELKDNPKRTLSDETINRIISLCYFLKPYVNREGDSLSSKLLSPERGQLLFVLAKLNLDTTSMNKIRKQATVPGADLREADLSGADLHEMDLRSADLKGANLKGVNLSKAHLEGSILWGANVSEANLDGTFFKSADMRWSDLNSSSLLKADLQEVDLTSAQLRKTDLRGAVMKWVDLTGSFLNEAKLDSADMFRAMLRRSQLTSASLVGTNLNLANLSEANLTDTNFTDANISDVIVSEQAWLSRFTEWKVVGGEDLQKKYKLMEDRSEKEVRWLVKKN